MNATPDSAAQRRGGLDRTSRLIIDILLTSAVLAAVGYLTGWLVGSSRTPAVVAIFPLIFGLLAGLGATFFERRRGAEILKKLLGDEAKEVPSALLAGYESKVAKGAARPYAWMVGIFCFCVACYLGVRDGVDRRNETYPTVKALLSNDVFSRANAHDRAVAHRLLWDMQHARLDQQQVQAVFKDVVAPILKDETDSEVRTTRLREAMNALLDPTADGNPPLDPDPLRSILRDTDVEPATKARLFRLHHELRAANVPERETRLFFHGVIAGIRKIDTELAEATNPLVPHLFGEANPTRTVSLKEALKASELVGGKLDPIRALLITQIYFALRGAEVEPADADHLLTFLIPAAVEHLGLPGAKDAGARQEQLLQALADNIGKLQGAGSAGGQFSALPVRSPEPEQARSTIKYAAPTNPTNDRRATTVDVEIE